MKRIPPVFYLLLVAIPYLQLSQAGWAWDDYGLVLSNDALTHPTWEKIWQRDLWCCITNKEVPTAYYRPLTTISFLLDYLLGPHPGLAHLHSLAWHMASTCLVYALLLRPTDPQRALMGALFFGLHPIQSEAVAWIAARNDLMAATFVIATLASLDQPALGNKRYPLAFAATLAGCLSKESAYLMPGYFLAWTLAFPRPQATLKNILRDLIPIFLACGLAFLIRSQAVLESPPTNRVAVDDVYSSVATTIITLLGWVSIPWPLVTSLTIYNTDFRLVSYLGMAITLLLLVRTLRQHPRQSAGLLGLSALAYAPAVGGLYWFGTIGERYLYLPLVGICGLVAWVGVPRWLSGGWLVMAVGVLMVRLPDWDSSLTLWRAAVARVPDSNAYQLLGSEYYRLNRWPEALDAYNTSLSTVPRRLMACPYVSIVATRVLSDAELEDQLSDWQVAGCRQIRGFDAPIAIWYARQGRWSDAEKWLRSAQQVDTKRRDRVIKGAIALVDGDLLMAGGEYVIAPEPGEYIDSVYSFTNHRSQGAP